jgi:heme-degrading monooxygenase HmoA
MWAQLTKMRLKTDKEQDIAALFKQHLKEIEAYEQPDSGLLRTMAMQDQNDPSQFYVLIVFDSEEKARAREQDPRRQEGLKSAMAGWAEIIDGPVEFVDLSVVQDVSA